MSNNQYNPEHNNNYGGSMPSHGGQQQMDSQRQHDTMGGSSVNPGSSMPRNDNENSFPMGQQNTANTYNNNYVGQNQSNSQPSYGQNPMHSSQNNYSQERPSMGGDNSGSQSHGMGSGMMGQSNLSQNQPPIGQRSYQPYPNPSYGGNQHPGQSMGQSMGGMPNTGSMGQSNMGNYGQNQNSSMPPVGMSSAPGTFQTSGGEKTYEPSMLAQNNASTNSAIASLPVSDEVKREFEEKSARCKQYKQTDVFGAILLKNEEDAIQIINHLVKNGTSLTAADTLDQTALFYAARDGKKKIVDMLLEAGCNPNHRDQYGQTPIYYAARENQLDIAQKLLEKGSDVNNEDMHQQTCLFYAAKQGHIDMISKLIDAGANVNHVDNKKKTPLYWAQKSRRSETVDYLISKGASATSRKVEKKKATKPKKPSNSRKEPKKYVLTTFVNGQWLPLTEEDFKKLEEQCPQVAQIIKDPSQLEKLEIPEVPEEAPIYDHWEKPAKRIIQTLWRQEGAWLFHYPVDVKAWKIEDYYTIVKDPMDFTTIKMKLTNNEYKDVDEFEIDVHKVFNNCILYNGESNQYSQFAKKIRQEFENQLKALHMDYYKK